MPCPLPRHPFISYIHTLSLAMRDEQIMVNMVAPKPAIAMNLYRACGGSEKHDNPCACSCRQPRNQQDQSEHLCHADRCHNSRLRRVLLPSLICLLVLFTILALSCTSGISGGGHGIFEPLLTGLAKRAAGNDSGGTFVNNKRALTQTQLSDN